MTEIAAFLADLDVRAVAQRGPLTILRAQVTRAQWRAAAPAARARGGRLVALWGTDRRAALGHDVVAAAYGLADGLAWLELPLAADAGENPRYPSLAAVYPCAGRMQRAAFDLSGLAAEPGAGEPIDARPWLRHAAWPAGFHPLRDASDGAARCAAPAEDYAFVAVAGDGVHEIAVGPVHAGIIEPGHFRFSVVGEKVLRLEERLGYVHKGIERRFAGMTLADGARLAARVSGDSTVAYGWAYCMAAEALAGVDPPPRAAALRAFALERERVANHLGDLGALGNDAGFAFGLAQFSRLREDWLRRNAECCGHRLLMDWIVPGGVSADPGAAQLDRLLADLAVLERQVREIEAIYDAHAGLQDRFVGAGAVPAELARRLDLTGMAARASGVGTDLRQTLGPPPYPDLGVRVAAVQGGDVAARVALRFAEVYESLRLLQRLLQELPAGPVRLHLAADRGPPGACAAGWIEGWRGEVLVALETGDDGRIRRAHCHDPSWQNWPALEHAVIGNIVPDFPLINKSFNLSYSGQDL